jgi:hypothetical protein
MKQKVDCYKVWVHIEGVTKDGDVIYGDEYFEPQCVGERKTRKQAEALRCKLMDNADE